MSASTTRAVFPRVLAVLAMMATWIVISPTPDAVAGCNGVNAPTFYTLSVGGVVRGHETVQYNSTCDGDKIYKGKVHDAKTDGSCVNAEYFESTTITAGVACTTGAWSNYTYWDQTGASGAWMRLCVNAGCGVWVWSHGY